MADDIKIGINAKGAASAAAGMRKVGKSARGLGKDLKVMATGAKAVQSAFAPLLAVFAAVKSIQGISNLISDSTEAYNTQAQAVIGATDAQKAFASELQNSLGVGDEATLAIMQQAKALGIRNDQLEEATKAAIGISEATGVGMNEALKKVNRALQGNADAFSESIPGIRDMATEQEKLDAINALVTRGLEKQSQKMQGLQGIQTRASNSWGDMLEVLGQILAPMRAIVSQGIAVFAETMQHVLAPAADFAAARLKMLPAILEGVKTAVVSAVTAIEVVYTNLPQIFEMVWTKVKLTWVQFSETAKHIFTVVVPQYISWFSENWRALMFDAATAVGIITTNAMSRMGELFELGFNAALDLASYFAKAIPQFFLSLAKQASSIIVNFSKQMAALFKLGFNAVLDLAEYFVTDLPKVISRFAANAASVIASGLNTISQLFASAWDYITGQFTGGTETASQSLSTVLSAVIEDTQQALADPPRSVADYSKEYGRIMSSNLLEGFQATTTSLPEIASRQITRGEKQLQEKLAALGNNLGEQFSSKFGERMKAIPTMVGGAFDAANLQGLGALAGGTTGAGSGGGSSDGLQAVQGRLLSRGRNEQYFPSLVENTERTAAELAKLNMRQEAEARKPSKPLIRVVEAVA